MYPTDRPILKELLQLNTLETVLADVEYATRRTPAATVTLYEADAVSSLHSFYGVDKKL